MPMEQRVALSKHQLFWCNHVTGVGRGAQRAEVRMQRWVGGPFVHAEARCCQRRASFLSGEEQGQEVGVGAGVGDRRGAGCERAEGCS